MPRDIKGPASTAEPAVRKGREEVRTGGRTLGEQGVRTSAQAPEQMPGPPVSRGCGPKNGRKDRIHLPINLPPDAAALTERTRP